MLFERFEESFGVFFVFYDESSSLERWDGCFSVAECVE